VEYRYFYQTSRNENREGWIEAPNRAEAYAALRKRGIRPYRVLGDDPSPWRRRGTVAGLCLAAACAAAAIAAAAVGALRGGGAIEPLARRQLDGDGAAIFAGIENCWDGVFATRLDRRLAAYAQPGWIAIPPDVQPGELEGYARDLETPLDFPDGEPQERRTLRRIVAGMRAEMAAYLASGGTIDGYLEFLDVRQDEEVAFRRNVWKALEAAGPEGAARGKIDLNARLRAMGMSEL